MDVCDTHCVRAFSSVVFRFTLSPSLFMFFFYSLSSISVVLTRFEKRPNESAHICRLRLNEPIFSLSSFFLFYQILT